MPCDRRSRFQSTERFGCSNATGLTLLEQDFESALVARPSGYLEGLYEEPDTASPCGRLATEKPTSLFARALSGCDVGSFNRYWPRLDEEPGHQLNRTNGRRWFLRMNGRYADPARRVDGIDSITDGH